MVIVQWHLSLVGATVSLSKVLQVRERLALLCFSCTLLNPSPTPLLARLQNPCLLGFQIHMSAVWGNG